MKKWIFWGKLTKIKILFLRVGIVLSNKHTHHHVCKPPVCGMLETHKGAFGERLRNPAGLQQENYPNGHIVLWNAGESRVREDVIRPGQQKGVQLNEPKGFCDCRRHKKPFFLYIFSKNSKQKLAKIEIL